MYEQQDAACLSRSSYDYGEKKLVYMCRLVKVHTYIHNYNFTEVQVSQVIIILLLQNCFVWFKDHTH